MIGQLKNPCHQLLSIIFIYNLGGVVFPREGSINQAVTALFLLYSLYYTIICYKSYKLQGAMKSLNVFFVVLSIYGMLLLLFGDEFLIRHSYDTYSYLRDVLKSISPIFAFYYFSRSGKLSIRGVQLWSFLLMISAIFVYYSTLNSLLLLHINSTLTEFTNNSGYWFAFLSLASLFFRGKPIIQYGIIGFCSVFLILCMKRGAVLVGAIVLLPILMSLLKEKKHRKEMIILLIFFALCGFYFMQDMLANSDYLIERIEDTKSGNSSGRDEIYGTLYSHFINKADIVEYLIGGGADTTIKIAGVHAHNDWLELATNQGLLGITLYIVFYYSMYKEYKRSKYDSNLQVIILSILLSLLSRSFISMSYMDIIPYAALIMGYTLALNHDKKKIIYD